MKGDMNTTQTRTRNTAWAAGILVTVAMCLSLPIPAIAEGENACLPSFPFKDGWWGADAAYSIPLPDDRTVWIFGDTLYGDERVVINSEPRMVRNSIGISTCNSEGEWTIEYVMRGEKTGSPKDFFQARDESYWYWALDGIFHDGHLWVTLLCVRPRGEAESEAFNFEACGTDFAKVSNLTANPEKWEIEYFRLVPDGVGAYPSAAALVKDDYMYIYALYEKNNRPMVLTRIALDALDAPAENLEYLARDGVWKPGLDPERAKYVMETGNTEMSVHYHSDLQKWIAVMNGPKFPSDQIILRTASSLWGPWTTGRPLSEIREMQPDFHAYDPDIFCYAAKEHPQYRRPGEIVVTYACNTRTVKKLETNLSIYFPRVELLSLPPQGHRPAK